MNNTNYTSQHCPHTRSKKGWKKQHSIRLAHLSWIVPSRQNPNSHIYRISCWIWENKKCIQSISQKGQKTPQLILYNMYNISIGCDFMWSFSLGFNDFPQFSIYYSWVFLCLVFFLFFVLNLIFHLNAS